MTSENLQKARIIVPCVTIGIGVICLVIGLVFPVPNEHLSTFVPVGSSSFHVEEYVGGDAYNYIIGACILGGHIAGAMATKSVFVAIGLVLICLGCFLLVFSLSGNSGKQQSDGTKSSLPSL